MLLVLFNAQLDTFLTVKFVNYQFNHAHQDNSTTHKMVSVPLVLTHALNVNTLPLTALLVQLVSPSAQADVLKPTAVELENSEPHQDHAQHAQLSVWTVSVPLNVQLVPLDTFITVPIVS